MISIIVPVYNCGECLTRCVDSLRAQTYSEVQILLVDDGSTDDTPALCDSLAERDNRITVIHKSNGGVSSARNAGIAAAEGAYVTFVDADDYVDADHLMMLYELLQRHHCDVAIGSYLSEPEDKCTPPRQNRDSRKDVCPVSSSPYGHDSAVCELLAGGAVGGYVWNKLYRRELLEGVAFHCDIKILEDLLFNYQVFENVQSAVFADTRSYHYIQRKESAMHRRFGDEHRRMVETATFIKDDLSGKGKALADAGTGLLATTILWVVDVMAEYGPYDKALVKQYQAAFKPLKKTYMKLKRVPLSYRASAVFFSMGYPIFQAAVKIVRKLKG